MSQENPPWFGYYLPTPTPAVSPLPTPVCCTQAPAPVTPVGVTHYTGGGSIMLLAVFLMILIVFFDKRMSSGV